MNSTSKNPECDSVRDFYLFPLCGFFIGKFRFSRQNPEEALNKNRIFVLAERKMYHESVYIRKSKRLVAAVFGTLIFTLGVNLFIVPINLYSGGFLGVGQIVRTLLVDYAHLPIPGQFDIAGILLYIINIPLSKCEAVNISQTIKQLDDHAFVTFFKVDAIVGNFNKHL